MNGDGAPDVAIGSPSYEVGAGKVYVAFGKTDSANIDAQDFRPSRRWVLNPACEGLRRAGYRCWRCR